MDLFFCRILCLYLMKSLFNWGEEGVVLQQATLLTSEQILS